MSETNLEGVAEESKKDNYPRIIEETNGEKFALSEAWVTFNGMKIVLAFYLDDEGNALDTGEKELWSTVEIIDAEGRVTYNDTGMDQSPNAHEAWVWMKLEAIHEGGAESGPLFEDDLPRVVSTDNDGYALTPAWVLHNNVRYVLLQDVHANGTLISDKYMMAVDDDGNYTLEYKIDSIPDAVDIDKRLRAIITGTAESGPLE